MKLGQNICLMKSRTSSKMGHVGSKTSPLGYILEKPCVRSRSRIFNPIIMKLGQNVCLNEISDDFEKRACRVKNQVTSSNVRKTLCTL